MAIGTFHTTDNGKKLVFWLTVVTLGLALTGAVRAAVR
jgi:hypothetical protein